VVIARRGAAPPPAPAAPETQTAGPREAGDGTLNFVGADVREVIGTVLGEILKLNYVVDPDVTGPVTFSVVRPLRREEVLPVLEAVLNSCGATLVNANGLVSIVPRRSDGKARAAAPSPRPRGG